MGKAGITLILIPLFLSPATSAFAQRHSMGVRLGATIASFGGEVQEILDLDSRVGFVGGFAFRYNFGRLGGVQPEILYVVKGATDRIEGFDVQVRIKYLELQLPVVLMIPVSGSVRPRVYAGPSVARELSCRVPLDDGFARLTFACDELLDLGGGGTGVAFTETKGLDFGVVFGGGMDVGAGPGAVTLDVRYDVGITNLNDLPGVDDSLHNRALELLAGYSFYFGGAL